MVNGDGESVRRKKRDVTVASPFCMGFAVPNCKEKGDVTTTPNGHALRWQCLAKSYTMREREKSWKKS